MKVGEDKPYDDINITPMLDLAYVLLVIFILMTTSTVQGLKATLPKASNAPAKKDDKKPKTKIVLIGNDGSITMDKQVMDVPQLEQALRSHKAANPDFPIVIRGDSETQYQKVMDVLDVAVGLNIKKIGLPTKPRQ